MRNGELPFEENARYAGVPNSQVYGSNVIVYSMCNNPMSKCWMISALHTVPGGKIVNFIALTPCPYLENFHPSIIP
eukprot:scaffold248413_cov39-Cyclotella_meneghiniana.AAC.3